MGSSTEFQVRDSQKVNPNKCAPGRKDLPERDTKRTPQPHTMNCTPITKKTHSQGFNPHLYPALPMVRLMDTGGNRAQNEFLGRPLPRLLMHPVFWILLSTKSASPVQSTKGKKEENPKTKGEKLNNTNSLGGFISSSQNKWELVSSKNILGKNQPYRSRGKK